MGTRLERARGKELDFEVVDFEEDPVERLSMRWLAMPANFMEE